MKKQRLSRHVLQVQSVFFLSAVLGCLRTFDDTTPHMSSTKPFFPSGTQAVCKSSIALFFLFWVSLVLRSPFNFRHFSKCGRIFSLCHEPVVGSLPAHTFRTGTPRGMPWPSLQRNRSCSNYIVTTICHYHHYCLPSLLSPPSVLPPQLQLLIPSLLSLLSPRDCCLACQCNWARNM